MIRTTEESLRLARTAEALKCLAGKLETIALDPDPDIETKITNEYNCANCDSYKVCQKMAKSLTMNKLQRKQTLDHDPYHARF